MSVPHDRATLHTEVDERYHPRHPQVEEMAQWVGVSTDADFVRYIKEQLTVARALYQGGYFDDHEQWTSPTRNFDDPKDIDFLDFGLEVRSVGTDPTIRMGLVGSGPSDVGGWQSYGGAPAN
ncbi:MAG: hypothetical protein ACRD0M_01030 [Acidimicrobiales bacterium]